MRIGRHNPHVLTHGLTSLTVHFLDDSVCVSEDVTPCVPVRSALTDRPFSEGFWSRRRRRAAAEEGQARATSGPGTHNKAGGPRASGCRTRTACRSATACQGRASAGRRGQDRASGRGAQDPAQRPGDPEADRGHPGRLLHLHPQVWPTAP